VGQGEFEALTLGTLAVIVVVGVIGYIAGAAVRREVAFEPIGPPDLPPDVASA
jgi:hypothetical protein